MERKKQSIKINCWKILYAKNSIVKESVFQPTTVTELEQSGYPIIDAIVPASFEYSLFKAGVCPDPYYSTNNWQMMQWEYYHQWYYTTIQLKDINKRIVFDGIDTVAEIYVNGVLQTKSENTFIPVTIQPNNLIEGENEIIVHILPAVIEARKYQNPTRVRAQKYTYPCLSIRKAPSSFGWDILPRFACGGIIGDVRLEDTEKSYFRDYYIYTSRIAEDGASVGLYYDFVADCDEIERFEVTALAKCGESSFEITEKATFTSSNVFQLVVKPKLWNPKGYGEQNFYDVSLFLKKDGIIVDEKKFRFGIRTVSLLRTSLTLEKGKFEFEVNGKKIFITGTNWVPIEALHVNEKERTLKALAMAEDLGVNMIRIWGGGYYGSDTFYEYCDEHGILVWQDFMMACAVYPNDERTVSLLQNEAISVVKRLRLHPSLAIWAGDNECDLAHNWPSLIRNPNYNVLNRKILFDVIRWYDWTRPYLPSSPYVDETSFMNEDYLSENHLWGQRDYFKCDYYKNAVCCFSSEIGYPGCSSPKSLQKYIKQQWPIFNENDDTSDEYRAHLSPLKETVEESNGCQVRRISRHVKTLFVNSFDNLSDYVKASQISQAEAYKFFIENFRIQRNTKGGILLWNLIEGWPQGMNNDIIDYYFVKKISYNYIKRSQMPLCLMFSEDNGHITLFGVNDTDTVKTVKYSIKNIYEDKVVLEGNVTLKNYFSQKIKDIKIPKNDKSFYYIQWVDSDGNKGSNHFHTDIKQIDFEKYITALNKVGYDEWEGF